MIKKRKVKVPTPPKQKMKPSVSTFGSSRSNHTRTHSSVMEENASDKISAGQIKRVVRKMQKANRQEQKRLSEKKITALLRKSIVDANPGMPELEVDALVLKKIDRAMGDYKGAGVLRERSPTAQDYLKKGRARVKSGMAKYR